MLRREHSRTGSKILERISQLAITFHRVAAFCFVFA
jgi:hypothetical protein